MLALCALPGGMSERSLGAGLGREAAMGFGGSEGAEDVFSASHSRKSETASQST